MTRLQMLAAVAMIAGCGQVSSNKTATCRYEDHDYAVGETWPAGDDCNDCTCAASGYTCTERPCHSIVDANLATLCHASATCESGPACGPICCGAGEQCVSGECKCGTGNACSAGDTCASAGPTGGDLCGSICCGASGPCPL